MHRRIVVALAALTLPAAAAVAHAQSGAGQFGRLGTFAGCSAFACHQFTLTEVARSGPVLPLPGVPGLAPQNVPSYLVDYALTGTTTYLAPAFAGPAPFVVTSFDLWLFRDGDLGEGGVVPFLFQSLDGLAPGQAIAWTFTSGASSPFANALTGYLPVDAPAGAAAVGYPTPFLMSDFWSGPDDAGGVTDVVSEFTVASLAVTSTPEPATVGLVGVGALLVLAAGYRRRVDAHRAPRGDEARGERRA
ncbi:PEP motif putative anchor domain protein (plasmid) [Gemmatirosa kalamazoonensis]|uniref:PEP motif putative anchor domain protein n=1 Tax=Gemmatirosa kalamazoonensis TaxID=861299 RepID=W0RMI9_9BACT|nr:PEP-CTERM sorting domain-containing protein [Gemmatirosa kalamazoonensis]AHG92254.1 PEP motif putative anchor domain protein [Gemmatirosa kalamazoonensis]